MARTKQIPFNMARTKQIPLTTTARRAKHAGKRLPQATKAPKVRVPRRRHVMGYREEREEKSEEEEEWVQIPQIVQLFDDGAPENLDHLFPNFIQEFHCLQFLPQWETWIGSWETWIGSWDFPRSTLYKSSIASNFLPQRETSQVNENALNNFSLKSLIWIVLIERIRIRGELP